MFCAPPPTHDIQASPPSGSGPPNSWILLPFRRTPCLQVAFFLMPVFPDIPHSERILFRLPYRSPARATHQTVPTLFSRVSGVTFDASSTFEHELQGAVNFRTADLYGRPLGLQLPKRATLPAGIRSVSNYCDTEMTPKKPYPLPCYGLKPAAPRVFLRL